MAKPRAKPDSDTRPNYGILATADIPSILAEIAAGASIREIAGRIGVSDVSLRAKLLRTDEPAYREALRTQVAERLVTYGVMADDAAARAHSAMQAVSKDETDSKVIAAATAQASVARAVADTAESAARHWRWLGERRDADHWGEKKTVNQQHSGTVELVARPQMSRDEWVAQHAHLPAKVSE